MPRNWTAVSTNCWLLHVIITILEVITFFFLGASRKLIKFPLQLSSPLKRCIGKPTNNDHQFDRSFFLWAAVITFAYTYIFWYFEVCTISKGVSINYGDNQGERGGCKMSMRYIVTINSASKQQALANFGCFLASVELSCFSLPILAGKMESVH